MLGYNFIITFNIFLSFFKDFVSFFLLSFFYFLLSILDFVGLGLLPIFLTIIIDENYVIEKKNQYNLSYYKSIYLLSIIIIGLIFKNITTSNIEFNNGEITNINNIHISNKKICIQNMSYTTTKLKPQIIIEKKKNMYNIWNKFINTL